MRAPNDSQYRFYPAGTALWQWMAGVAIQGNYAYCAMPSGVEVIDLTDPSQPRVVGRLERPVAYFSGGSVAYGDLLLFKDSGYGAKCYNISDPLNPSYITMLNEYPGAAPLIRRDHLVYDASGAYLSVLDLSQGILPVRIGRVQLSKSINDMTLQGDFIYVATTGSLYTICVTNPSSPGLCGNQSSANLGSIAVHDSHLYALDDTDSCRVYELVTAWNPVYIGAFPAPNATNCDLECYGGYLYICDRTSMDVYSLETPSAPEKVGDLSGVARYSKMVREGSRMLAVHYQEGFTILDLSTPSQPAVFSKFQTPGEGRKIELRGDYVYEANGIRGLQVLNIADPANPLEVATLDCDGESRGIALVGDLVYLASGMAGMRIIDVGTPTAPIEISSLPLPGEGPLAVAVNGNYAYLCGPGMGLQIADISNPLSPFLVGGYPMDSNLCDLDYDSGLVATTSYGRGWVYFFDVTEATQPSFLSSVFLGSDAVGVEMVGRTVYAIDLRSELTIIDANDPVHPQVIKIMELPRFARDLWIDGNLAYIANYTYGVSILDISNPAEPILLGDHNTNPVWVWDIRARDGIIYACGDNAFMTLYYGGCLNPNGDDMINITDVIFLVNFIFGGGPAPSPPVAGDVDCDSMITISDAVVLIQYIFASGVPPCGC